MINNLRLTLCFLIFSAGFSFAQNDTINQLDTLGRRQGYWIITENFTAANGFPTEAKVEEGRYIDNSKEGYWTTYYKDGETPRLKGEYEYNCPNGNFKKYYDNGILKEEGIYTSHHYFGTLKRYYPSGELKYLGKFNEEGKEIDTVLYLLKDGCKEFMLVHYPDGKKNLYHYYLDNCNVIEDSLTGETGVICTTKRTDDSEYFGENWMLNKQRPKISVRNSKGNKEEYSDAALCHLDNGKIYNTLDEIIFEGNCKDGKVWDGKMYFYDKDGILLNIEIWRNGSYHSDGQL